MTTQRVNFYAQQVEVDKTTKRHTATLDITTAQDGALLERSLPGFVGADGFDRDSQSSMIRFSYLPSGRNGLKEGSWYDIDLGVFSGAGTLYRVIDAGEAGASYLRAELVGDAIPGDFSRYLTAPRYAETTPRVTPLVIDPSPTGTVELTVVDCGHGNWNEVTTTTERIFYDVGAGRSFTQKQVRDLVAGRNIEPDARPIALVISHWDVDHYLALLEFSDAEISKLRLVIVPSQVPDTLTYRRVRDRLTSQRIPIEAMQPATPLGASKVITLQPAWSHGMFTLYRATPGRSRNQTGIVLRVNGLNKVACLTGDHHYAKILVAIKKTIAGDEHCVLVVPHHGGHAGPVSGATWVASFKSITTPISCGPNSHGHPFAVVEKELKLMQGGAPVWKTQTKGDWTTTL